MEIKIIKENYEKGINEIVKPFLKKRGFNKNGKFSFYRIKNDFVQEINFDRSSRVPEKFTVCISIQILTLPICFIDKLEFPKFPFKRGAGMQNFLKWWELSEDVNYVNVQLKRALNVIESISLEWLNKYSDYNGLIKIYEEERDRLLENYMIGRWADLVGAISYEKIGNKKKALQIYKNMSGEDLYYLKSGVKEFVKDKIKELDKDVKRI